MRIYNENIQSLIDSVPNFVPSSNYPVGSTKLCVIGTIHYEDGKPIIITLVIDTIENEIINVFSKEWDWE